MLRTLSFALFVLTLILSAASLLFGAVSWILMKKWRQFRHFVFLSLIVSGANFLSCMQAWTQMKQTPTDLVQFIPVALLIIHMQMNHWQLITTIMIYKDLVNVFSSVKVKCKYLAVCMFAWFLPVIESVVMVFAKDDYLISWFTVAILELSLMAANVVLYVRVVYTLVRLMMRQKISARDVMGKLLVSTLVCVTAGLVPIFGTIFLICFADHVLVTLLDDPDIAILPNLVNLLLANLFFLSMKSHRLLWAEYISRIRNTRATRRELEMQLPRHEAPIPAF